MNESPILIAFATRTNSTALVAAQIGICLRGHDFNIHAMSVDDVTDIAQYQAVIAGSAIQHGAWLPEALAFVQRFQAPLREKPFAAFLVCMTLAMNHENWRDLDTVRPWLDPVRQLVPTASDGYFAEQLTLKDIPKFKDRLMFRFRTWMGMWSPADHRNQAAITAWANELPAKLGLGEKQPSA